MNLNLATVENILARVDPEIPWSRHTEDGVDYLGVLILIWHKGFQIPFAGAKFWMEGSQVACQFTTRPEGTIPEGEMVAMFQHEGQDYVWPAINLPTASSPTELIAQAHAVVSGFNQVLERYDTPLDTVYDD